METNILSEQGELCEICGKIFTHKTKLNEHISAIHEGKKPYKHGICFEIDILTRLPHIGKEIFDSVDNLSLFKCKETSRSWCDFIDSQ